MKDKMMVLNTPDRVDRVMKFKIVFAVLPVASINRLVFSCSERLSIPIDGFEDLCDLAEAYREEVATSPFYAIIDAIKSQMTWFIQLKLLRGDYLFEEEEGDSAESIVLEDTEVAHWEVDGDGDLGFDVYDIIRD